MGTLMGTVQEMRRIAVGGKSESLGPEVGRREGVVQGFSASAPLAF